MLPSAPVSRESAAAAESVVGREGSGTAVAPASTDKSVIVYFAFDSARLSTAGRAVLDAWLAGERKESRIVIFGHADRLGPASYNRALSRRRAETVRAYLVGKGVDASRIEIIAMGESQPVKHCKGGANPRTIACLAPNRRVEINP